MKNCESRLASLYVEHGEEGLLILKILLDKYVEIPFPIGVIEKCNSIITDYGEKYVSLRLFEMIDENILLKHIDFSNALLQFATLQVRKNREEFLTYY